MMSNRAEWIGAGAALGGVALALIGPIVSHRIDDRQHMVAVRNLVWIAARWIEADHSKVKGDDPAWDTCRRAIDTIDLRVVTPADVAEDVLDIRNQLEIDQAAVSKSDAQGENAARAKTRLMFARLERRLPGGLTKEEGDFVSLPWQHFLF